MDTVVWLRSPFTGSARPRTVPCGARVRDLLPPGDQGYPVDNLFVKCNGRLVSANEELQNGLVYSVEPRLCGGKGGFGSMLRALGAQIEKTTNREACRDLSGRRLRDVNHENAMADWLKQQAEREAEKEQRRLDRLQRKLAEPKHYFTNTEYQKQCSEMSERLEDSVLKGMQASSSSMVLPEASSSLKRPNMSEIKAPSSKKKRFWTGLEGVEDSGDSDRGESDGENSTSESGASEESKENPSACMREDTPEESGSEENETSNLLCTTDESTQDHHVGDLGGDFTENIVRIQSLIPDAQTETNTVVEELAFKVETVKEIVDDCYRPKEITRCDLLTESAKKASTQIDDFESDLICPKTVVEGLSSNVLHGVNGSENNGNAMKKEETIQAKEIVAEEGIHPPIPSTDLPVDLMTFASASELECLGLETLKQELMTRGLKCGGTLQERASRLFSVRGLTREQMEPTLFAKPSKGRKK